MKTKICTKCKEEKLVDEYAKDTSRKSGRIARCKRCVSACDSERYLKNKEKIDRRNKEWYAKNREKTLIRGKQYYTENKEVVLKRSRDRYSNNKELRANQDKIWTANNRTKKNEARARRRALKKSLQVEKISYTKIRERDHTCYLCNKLFTDEERLSGAHTHVDHKIPLSRIELNPTHSYENCALTHKECNLAKCDKTPEEYWAT